MTSDLRFRARTIGESPRGMTKRTPEQESRLVIKIVKLVIKL
jgi:hypothetical protein